MGGADAQHRPGIGAVEREDDRSAERLLQSRGHAFKVTIARSC